jgi:flagellar biosynthesis/type III secretory pathway M-ring protein FliF/YscJ
MELTKKTLVVLGLVAMVGIILLTMWLFWPNKEDDIKQDLQIKGSDNKVQTTQTKDFSLIHVENLRAENQKNNVINWTLFTIIIVVIIGYGAHYRMYRVPRRIEQEYSAQRKEDKVDEIETTLVDLGYLKKKKKMSAKKKKGMKSKRSRMYKKKEEEEEEFEEE